VGGWFCRLRSFKLTPTLNVFSLYAELRLSLAGGRLDHRHRRHRGGSSNAGRCLQWQNDDRLHANQQVPGHVTLLLHSHVVLVPVPSDLSFSRSASPPRSLVSGAGVFCLVFTFTAVRCRTCDQEVVGSTPGRVATKWLLLG